MGYLKCRRLPRTSRNKFNFNRGVLVPRVVAQQYRCAYCRPARNGGVLLTGFAF